jgi:PEP-CTERM motif-containing protein
MAAHRLLLGLVAALVGLVSVNSARADEVKFNLTRDTTSPEHLTNRVLATETHADAMQYVGDKRNGSAGYALAFGIAGNPRHTIEDLTKESPDRDDEGRDNKRDHDSRVHGDRTPTHDLRPIMPTPEPASVALFGTGLLGIGIWMRKRLYA